MNQLIIEKLNQIEQGMHNAFQNRYLNIKQTAEFTSLSLSTIRRAVYRGELKCSRRLGKLLFKVSDIENWLNEK